MNADIICFCQKFFFNYLLALTAFCRLFYTLYNKKNRIDSICLTYGFYQTIKVEHLEAKIIWELLSKIGVEGHLHSKL